MRYIVVIMILFSILVSCTNRPVTPTRNSRRAIDTIYQQKVMVLQPKMDSACAHMYDSLYSVAVDSILNVRQMEMNELVK
jgi:hypothetical protein